MDVGREIIGVGLGWVFELVWYGLRVLAVPALDAGVSWARASSASVGVSWGSAMSLPGGLFERSAGVRGCGCMLLECEGSGTWSSRTSLCGGSEGVAERCCSSSLSLDGRDLGFFVYGCGQVAGAAVVLELSMSEGRLSGIGSLGLGMLRLLLLLLRSCGGVG